jgi:RES domain-containing protein
VNIVRLPAGTVLYRVLTPQWAFQPLSGRGAALIGGRFNRPGLEAIYLSEDILTAVREYRRNADLTPPVTLCSYLAGPLDVIDLTGPQPDTDPWRDWRQPWNLISRYQQATPPSWDCGDAALAAGCQGIRFPSTRAGGGTNLALYTDRLTPNRLAVYDPEGALPRSQRSWQ